MRGLGEGGELRLSVAWTLAYVLPNLQLRSPVETLSGAVAIVPHSDPRLTVIKQTSNVAETLLDGFRDIYSHRLEPSAVILRDDAPTKVKSVPAIVDFRNSVALSCILPGYAQLRPSLGSPINPLWSDAFAFYPVTVSRGGTLITITPAVSIGSSPGTPFMGMPNPGLVVYSDRMHVDFRLLGLLLRCWERRYVRPGRETWKLRAVFRSLEMAYRALEVPIANESSIHDAGTALALWVSAFEILAHSANRTDKINESHVLTMLRVVPWSVRRLRHRRYKVEIRQKVRRTTLAEHIYHALYQARNAFLHGNAVRRSHWRYSASKESAALGNLAPVLYRSALACHLEWTWTKTLTEQMGRGNLRGPFGSGLTQCEVDVLLAFSDAMYDECLASLVSGGVSKVWSRRPTL